MSGTLIMTNAIKNYIKNESLQRVFHSYFKINGSELYTVRNFLS